MKRFNHRYKITISDQRFFNKWRAYLQNDLRALFIEIDLELSAESIDSAECNFFSKLAKVDVSRFANKLLKYITELIYGWSHQKFILAYAYDLFWEIPHFQIFVLLSIRKLLVKLPVKWLKTRAIHL